MAGYVNRFAPSPTGPLHLGHAFSALTAWDRATDGTFLLRIEDLDQGRSRPEWVQGIYDDLHWLGLDWPEPLFQSTRLDAYDAALARLAEMGVTYACTCSRADIRAAQTAPQEGPDGLIYPGTCRALHRRPGPDDAVRLDMAAALTLTGPLSFTETGIFAGEHRPTRMVEDIGDVVLSRRTMGAAYHLAVVVDDAFQNVSEAVRGADLFAATPIHVLLGKLLGLPAIRFHHHRLIRDEAGKRLAKRDDARAIAAYRAEGATPEDVRRMVGLA